MKDLIVIGGGPGGYVAAIRAAQLGMSVCLVEKDSLGGTCLNRGCIPTKAYFQNAAVLRTLARLGDYSVEGGEFSFDLAKARERKNKIVGNLAAGVQQLLKANHVQVISGEATLKDAGTVVVGDEEIHGQKVLIATGSIPSIPPIPGAELPGVLTSDEMLDLDTPPRSLAIIGGGVIGMEFACIFRSFGCEVTVLEFQPSILGNVDQEILKRMGLYLRKQKITLHTGTAVQEISHQGDSWLVTATGKKGELKIKADLVLVSTGRKPCTSGLDLDALGINCSDNGLIKVDDNYETSLPGVYAIGDVVGKMMLAHVASEEGIAAVERMNGLSSNVDYEAVPSCIFTFPEISTVGLSEAEATSRGLDVKVGKFPFAANGKAMAMGETDGLVKVVADGDDVIRGIHILGPHASDLIQEAAVIVRNKMKLTDVINTIPPPPTLGEALHEAVMDAAGRAIHLASRH